MSKFLHPFHIVTVSPWPLMVGMGALMMVISLVNLFVFKSLGIFMKSLILVLIISMVWWRDVIRESTFQGYHSSFVLNGLMFGMILFIVSEIFFFLSFFWTFFHSSLSPTIELGSIWPPVGIMVFNPFQVPLLNTIILLSSGVSVTWAHQSMLKGDWDLVYKSLLLTWILGVYFLLLQAFEYKSAMFSIADSVYGSVFFVATGFHGMHVILGTIFLFIMWMRVKKLHFSFTHHFGFEAAAWYWHFVDVVWLFLFSMVYWWGS